MLRPSRPMMRPFMSSAWSWTTDTVVSAAWPAARRCMTTERMLRTRRSASRLVSSSIARRRRADSWRTWSSSSFSSSALACDADMPEARSSCADRLLADLVDLRLLARRAGARARRARRRARRAPPRAPCRRSSRRVASARRAAVVVVGGGGAGVAPWRRPGARPSPPPRASPAGQPRPPGPRPPRPPRSRFPLRFLSPAPLPVGCGASSFTGLWQGGRPSRASAERRRRAGRRPHGRPVRWRL